MLREAISIVITTATPKHTPYYETIHFPQETLG